MVKAQPALGVAQAHDGEDIATPQQDLDHWECLTLFVVVAAASASGVVSAARVLGFDV
jgi:hypothetical protein